MLNQPPAPEVTKAERDNMKLRKRGGVLFTASGHKNIICTVTGEMTDGRKIWTECDCNGNLINIEKQYFLQTRGNWSEFVRV